MGKLVLGYISTGDLFNARPRPQYLPAQFNKKSTIPEGLDWKSLLEKETAPVFWGFRNRWLDTLTDEQIATLKEMIEENRAEVKDQLEEWGVEIPMRQGPMGLLGSLTDEQKEELQTMRQEYLDAVKAKLEELGNETPEVNGPPQGGMVHGPRPGGMGFRGRGARGFSIFEQ